MKLCGIFCPDSVDVARYGTLIPANSSTNYDAHLADAESLFQTRSEIAAALPENSVGSHFYNNFDKILCDKRFLWLK